MRTHVFNFSRLLLFSVSLAATVSCSQPSKSSDDPFVRRIKAREHDEMGVAYYTQGEYRAARREFTVAIDLEPNNPTYLYHRGLALEADGSPASAAYDYKTALVSAPDNWPFRSEVIAAFRRVDPVQAAAFLGEKTDSGELTDKEFDQMLEELEAHIERAYARNDYAEVEAFATKLLKKFPKSTEFLELRADARSKGGNFRGAIRDMNEIIRLEPDQLMAYLTRAAIRDAMGDSKGALADCDVVLKKDPTHGEAYFFRGDIRFLREEFAEAEYDYYLAVKNGYDSNEELFVKQGVIFYLRGRFDDAIKQWEKALRINRDVQTPPYTHKSLQGSLRNLIKGAKLPNRHFNERPSKAAGKTVYLDITMRMGTDKSARQVMTNGYYHNRKPCFLLNPKEYVIVASINGALTGTAKWSRGPKSTELYSYKAEPCPRCVKK